MLIIIPFPFFEQKRFQTINQIIIITVSDQSLSSHDGTLSMTIGKG